MSDESQRFKDALKRSLEATRQPNPLEILQMPTELVRTLDPEALVIAARGISRAMQLALHPDRAARQRKNSTERLQRIQAAQKAVEADPTRVRRTYLDAERAKRAKKPSTETARQLQGQRREERRFDARKNLVVAMLDTLYGPESIAKIKEGRILTRPVTIFPSQRSLPMGAITINEGKAAVQPMRYFDTIEIGNEAVKTVTNEFPDLHSHSLLIPYKDRTEIITTKGQYISDASASDVLTPGNWYELRGIAGETKETTKRTKRQYDNRSLLIYTPIGPQEPIKLLGCITSETAKWAQSSHMVLTQTQGIALYNILTTSPDVEVPAHYSNNLVLSNSIWEGIVAGDGVEQEHILFPTLLPLHVLIGENSEGTKTMLGAIQHHTAVYF